MEFENRFSKDLFFSNDVSYLIFIIKLLIGYFSFVAYVKSIDKPIFSIHDNLFNKPEVIMLAGIAIVYQATGSIAISIYTLLFYYVTTIAQNNVKKTYQDSFGSLSPFFIKLSKAMGFWKKDLDLDLDIDFNLNTDSESDIESDTEFSLDLN